MGAGFRFAFATFTFTLAVVVVGLVPTSGVGPVLPLAGLLLVVRLPLALAPVAFPSAVSTSSVAAAFAFTVIVGVA